MPSRRFDKGELRKDARTAQGFLRADAVITRAGVFAYRNQDGSTRRELRLPEEVFAPEALRSFSLAPLTLDHPPEAVTAENAQRYSVGTVGEELRRDGALMRTSVLVTHADAVNAVEAGKRELSCGYECDLEVAQGDYQGERYDAIQRNIRGNHVAIVAKGRAGPVASLKLDASDAVQVDDPPGRNTEESVVKKTIAGVEYEMSEQVAQAIDHRDSQQATALKEKDDQLASVSRELKAAREEQAKETARADAAVAERDKAEKARTDALDPGRLREAVRLRVLLERSAAEVLGKDEKLDSLSERAIKESVVKKVHPEAKLDGLPDAYVDGRFAAALEAFARSDSSLEKLRAALPPPKPGERVDTAVSDARARMISQLESAHQATCSSARE